MGGVIAGSWQPGLTGLPYSARSPAGVRIQLGAVAVGALPDGTPVIVSGGDDDGTVRVWRLADGAPVRDRCAATPAGWRWAAVP